MGRVIVVGSINIDMVMTTKRLPKIGETILGEDMNYFMGGKGANQAVASARIGSKTTLFASLGDDTFGQTALKHLNRESIDTSLTKIEKNIFTGLASIFSIQNDNSIVVSPGANMLLKITDKFKSYVKKDDIILAQLEVPVSTIEKAFKIAKEKGSTTILNPAPYDEAFYKFIELIDIITPNETEFESMIGYNLTDENFEEAMLDWSNNHSTTLVLTRGSNGVSYVEDGKVITIPPHKVVVQDTTGAGDTFNGILASLLSQGYSMDDSIKYADYGAALSTTKIGAQTGMPTFEEISTNG